MAYETDYDPAEYLARRLKYYEKKLRQADKIKEMERLIEKYGAKLPGLVERHKSNLRYRIMQYENAILKLTFGL